MMEYPKQTKKKKRTKHPPSVMHQEPGTCYLCVRLHGSYVQHRGLHKHHAFGGSNRAVSEENGLWVKICWQHHTYGAESVHNNAGNMRLIQEDVQREYEKTHTRQQFVGLIGRNYIMEDEDGQEKA